MKHILVFIAFALAAFQPLMAQTTISAGRAIEIQLKGVPSEEMALVSGTYTVSETGMISMPLLVSSGELLRGGRSMNGVEDARAACYASIRNLGD